MVLNLRYPGAAVLPLVQGRSRQEVLLLHQAVRDRAGNILMPAGTQVIGRFETSNRGSRFIAQAIALQGRNLPLAAESDLLSHRQFATGIPPNQLLQIRLNQHLR